MLGVVLFRFLGAHTTFGQNFDFSAIRNGLALGGNALNSSNALLNAVSATSLVLTGAVLVGSFALRRRYDVAIACTVILLAPYATTELLKHVLPARSGVPDYLANGFPSGHSTVALSVGLALILASPPAQRRLTAALAAVYATAMGAVLVFNAWHLPSDVGGGFCVALAWAAVVAGVASRPVERGLPVRLLAVVAALVALSAVAAVDLRPGLSFSVTVHGRLFEAVAGIALTAACCCAAFAYAIAVRSASATRS